MSRRMHAHAERWLAERLPGTHLSTNERAAGAWVYHVMIRRTPLGGTANSSKVASESFFLWTFSLM